MKTRSPANTRKIYGVAKMIGLQLGWNGTNEHLVRDPMSKLTEPEPPTWIESAVTITSDRSGPGPASGDLIYLDVGEERISENAHAVAASVRALTISVVSASQTSTSARL